MTELKPYWQRRRDAKLANTEKHAILSRKKALDAFYDFQAINSPNRCENCGKSLIQTILFHPRAHIAHILPKSTINGCPSVATHPENRWFACQECHTNYDNANYDKEQMKVLPILKARLKLFFTDIAFEERRRIPRYLL